MLMLYTGIFYKEALHIFTKLNNEQKRLGITFRATRIQLDMNANGQMAIEQSTNDEQ